MTDAKTLRRHKYRLQNRCRANKLTVEPHFNWRTARLGQPAIVTLKRYQKFVGIQQTGYFDGRTLDALYPSRFRKRIAAKALSQVGVHEWPAGSNAGPVMKFIEPFIGHVRTAWCALFGAWSGWQASFPKDAFWKDVAWVDSWEREAKDPANKHVTKIGKLQAGRGDFGLEDWEHDGNPDHLVVVTWKVGPVAVVHTVEGNVGDYGGSVTKKIRLVTQTHCFIRLNRYTKR